MTGLKKLLEENGLSQRWLAGEADVSPATMSAIVTNGRWPKTINRAELEQSIRQALTARGLPEAEIAGAFEKKRGAKARKAKQTKENISMLRKQGLSPKAKRLFNLPFDPFGEVGEQADVYQSEQYRYVLQSMLDVAKHGGFLAVVGESGAGKSTLRRDMITRILNEGLPVIVIEPCTIGIEDNLVDGRRLKAAQIQEAIMADVAPNAKLPRSPELRERLLKKTLIESNMGGNKHCLIIEESHRLHPATLKHLKGFLELEHGLSKLLSVILIGQPELYQKLRQNDHSIREVVQRCEVVSIPPMDGELPEFVRHRFARAGADAASIITDEGIEALRAKLTGPAPRGRGKGESRVYPLAVGNWLTAAMNKAAELGAPVVDEDIVNNVSMTA
jgi:type II secretory pathway predicted ATPase ExeA